MTLQTATLPNGFRVVTEHMPGLKSAALGIWVSAGGRHERPEQNGVAHFLEHMAFKGTASRSALRIAEDEDAAVETLVLGDTEGPVRLWQGVVPQDQWQAAQPLPGPHGYAFVSCIVAPGFEFAGFELAAPGWAPREALASPRAALEKCADMPPRRRARPALLP